LQENEYNAALTAFVGADINRKQPAIESEIATALCVVEQLAPGILYHASSVIEPLLDFIQGVCMPNKSKYEEISQQIAVTLLFNMTMTKTPKYAEISKNSVFPDIGDPYGYWWMEKIGDEAVESNPTDKDDIIIGYFWFCDAPFTSTTDRRSRRKAKVWTKSQFQDTDFTIDDTELGLKSVKTLMAQRAAEEKQKAEKATENPGAQPASSLQQAPAASSLQQAPASASAL